MKDDSLPPLLVFIVICQYYLFSKELFESESLFQMSYCDAATLILKGKGDF